jgi:hypothetical protein
MANITTLLARQLCQHGNYASMAAMPAWQLCYQGNAVIIAVLTFITLQKINGNYWHI